MVNPARAAGLFLSCASLCLLACPGAEPEGTGESSTSSSEATGPAETETETETETTETETGETCTMVTAVTLERELAGAQLPTPLPEEGSADLVVTMPSSIGGDESIYLLVDSQLNGLTFTTQFSFLAFDLSEACGFNLALDLFDVEPLPAADTTLVDVSSGDPVPVPLVAADGDGLKVWDITELEPEDADCGSRVLTSISLDPDLSPYRVGWNYTGMDDEVRSLRMYAGRIAEVCI